MELVMICAQMRFMERRLHEVEEELSLKVTKIKPPYIYFDVETDDDFNAASRKIKKVLNSGKNVNAVCFEIYKFHNGKVDLMPYASDATKSKYAYFSK